MIDFPMSSILYPLFSILYPLSSIIYPPSSGLVGLTGIEPVTSSLSGTRSNQLSYKPSMSLAKGARNGEAWREAGFNKFLLRKEVIQPLVPQRLPCYDFIPITTHTLG